jgi:hypothetical protein
MLLMEQGLTFGRTLSSTGYPDKQKQKILLTQHLRILSLQLMSVNCHRRRLKILKPPSRMAFLFSFAVRTGLEPATHGVTGRYSNQLNYRTKLFLL